MQYRKIIGLILLAIPIVSIITYLVINLSTEAAIAMLLAGIIAGIFYIARRLLDT